MTALLHVADLSVRFATPRGMVQAVDGVGFDIAAGEVLGLVGESGSGKSVTLRAIARLLHSNATVSGQVRWRNSDVLALADEPLRRLRGAEIGMVFQEPMSALNPVLPIGVQIDESLRAHGDLSAAQRAARARELLGLVGIAAAGQRLAQ